MIRPYLDDIINDHKTQGNQKIHSPNTIIDYKTQEGWKIKSSMIISSKDSNEIRILHTTSNNIEILMGNKTDEITEELFEYPLQKYQEGLEEQMRGSEFVFDSDGLLHYNLHKKIKQRWIKYEFSSMVKK